MKVGTKEHYEIMEQFEKDFSHLRLDKEPKSSWRKGTIYQSGKTNDWFLVFRCGYSFGRCVYL